MKAKGIWKKRMAYMLILLVLMPRFYTTKGKAEIGEHSVGGIRMDKITGFSMDQVVLTDPYLENSLQLEVDYLLEFDVDKLLAGFRETAGLDMKGYTRYGGWENSLIGGHTLGHYLTACSQAYKNPGVSKEDKAALYQQITDIVDGLLECQQNSKGKPGFIFGATILDKNNVELQFDNVESRKSDIMKEAWVPWYTMHKLIAGLVDTYNLTGYEGAKMVASGLGDWTYNRASSWSKGKNDTVLGIEYGGMNDCLYELYLITGKEEHAIAAHCFDEINLFTRIKNGVPNALNGRHANTTIPKFLGGLKRYIALHGKEMEGQVVDATEYLEAAIVFWDTVVYKHTYITGGNSEWEHFGYDNILDAERTNCNNETCNIYNMLKLSKELFQITGNRKYADFYENAYLNSILSSQNPETGMTMYFQPMDSGYFKVYGSKFSHFWCCTGSGMENFTKLNDSIYYKKGNALIVNMYLSSILTWEEGQVEITQSSFIPMKDTAEFTVKSLNGQPVSMEFLFRVPDWASEDIVIKVNGNVEKVEIQEGYALLHRTFTDGDMITVTIPMKVVAHGLPDNNRVFAFKYGPLVLSAELGTKSMVTGTTGMNVTIPAKALLDSKDIILKESSGTVEDFILNIERYLIRENDTLKFTLTGTINGELTFSPHYQQHKQRYGIYWPFYSYEESLKRAEEGIRFDYQVLDSIKPGLGQYESDDLHQMAEERSFAATQDIYRYAGKDGWFTYQMIIDPLQTNYLLFSLKKEDNGKSLEVKIHEEVIYSNTLNYDGDKETYQIRVKIPNAVIDSSRKIIIANEQPNFVVAVTFSGASGAISARVCEMIQIVNINPRYDVDNTLAYFVDCGDHDVSTLSPGDAFGRYNSVTEQMYGEDPVTGYRWGLVDDSTDQYGGSSVSEGIYSANTWCYEYLKTDGVPKTESNRYTKNQIESGITPRFIDYSFELPNGHYTIEVGFADPWSVSDHPSLYANIGKDTEMMIAENISVASNPIVHGIVEVTDGELTINARSLNNAINITYIMIGIVEDEEKIQAIKDEYKAAKDSMKNVNQEHEEEFLSDLEQEVDDSVETMESNHKQGRSKFLTYAIGGIVTIVSLAGVVYLLVRKKKLRKK